MPPKTKPLTTGTDYNEGPQAADRFNAAIGRLASLPASAAPRPEPTPRKKAKGKKK